MSKIKEDSIMDTVDPYSLLSLLWAVAMVSESDTLKWIFLSVVEDDSFTALHKHMAFAWSWCFSRYCFGFIFVSQVEAYTSRNIWPYSI